MLHLTNMGRRSLLGVISVLILVCRHESAFCGILKEVVQADIAGILSDRAVGSLLAGVLQLDRNARQFEAETHPDDGDAVPERHAGVQGRVARSPSSPAGAAASGRDLAAADRRPPSSSSATGGGAGAGAPSRASAPLERLVDLPTIDNRCPSAAAFAGAHGGGTALPTTFRGGRGSAARHGMCGGGLARESGVSGFRSSGSLALDAARIFQAHAPSLTLKERIVNRRLRGESLLPPRKEGTGALPWEVIPSPQGAGPSTI